MLHLDSHAKAEKGPAASDDTVDGYISENQDDQSLEADLFSDISNNSSIEEKLAGSIQYLKNEAIVPYWSRQRWIFYS